MKFGFVAKHRSIWPLAWLCEALGVSRLNPHFSNKVAHRASESGKSCFVITTCADLEGWPDADGV